MPRVTLIFPPGTDPRSPHLGLAALAAALRRENIDTEMLDLGLGGLLYLMAPERLQAAGERVRRRAQDESTRRLALLAESLPWRVEDAFTALRDCVRFYDPNEYQAAREAIYDGLELVSAASGRGIRYTINPAGYELEGVDAESLGDLIRASADRQCNLFADYWEDRIFPALAERRPDVAGISVANRQQLIPALMLARELRRRGHFVVLGGTVFSKFAESLARLPEFFECFADGVVPYEGDTAIVELAMTAQTTRAFRRVPNYLYMEDGVMRHTRVHVEDVDSLPTPDFGGLPLGQYLAPAAVLPIFMGKGCYHNRCRFCDIPYSNRIAPTPYRVRSPERVVEDVLRLERLFGCRHFEFTDETLAPALLGRLAEGLAPQGRRFGFSGYARLESAFTGTLCRRLAAMGLKKLYFGLESADQATLDHMRKGIHISSVPGILRNCSEAGIRFHLFSIIGFPEESEASARKTFEFFRDHAELINRPGNSFDIHRFGLELRSEYARETGATGIGIEPQALAREFVVGAGRNWSNPRGLSHQRVDELLGEFHAGLRHLYSAYRDPEYPWPAFEEYAILYAEQYGERAFPYRTSLPAETDSTRFRLRWSPSAAVDRRGGDTVRVISRAGTVQMEPQAYDLLASPQHRTTAARLDELAGGIPELRELMRRRLNDLLTQKLLQFEPEICGFNGAKKDNRDVNSP